MDNQSMDNSQLGQLDPSQLLSSKNVAVSEILNIIITPSLGIRKAEWASEIGSKLMELGNANRIQMHELAANEQFVDTVLQATTFAMKTGDKEKVAVFRNVIINTALGDSPEQTISHIFLNLIDEFTTWHIKILKFFNGPEEWFKENHKVFPDYISSTLARIVKEAFLDLVNHDELLDLIGSNLYRSKLLNTGDLRGTISRDGLIAIRTTNMGKQFLKYISEN